jgi:hypothetical protein
MRAPDYAARVAAGAAFLDKQMPGWAERIDLGQLDLFDECGCVLGQLGGNYHRMRDYFGLDMKAAALLGFTLSVTAPHENWAILDDLWADEVKKRHEPAQVTS